MKKFSNKFFQSLELVLLILAISFLTIHIFSPGRIAFRKFPQTVEITKDKISFQAVINTRHEKVSNLISLDTQGWCEDLGIWDKELFQKTLDKNSFLVTGVDLRIVRRWILSNKINWYSAPFQVNIILVLDTKQGPKELKLKDLVENEQVLSLEDIMFLGLGIDSFVQKLPDKDKRVVAADEFLKNFFKKNESGIILKKHSLLEGVKKLKIVISF